MVERVKPDNTERLNKITKINEGYPSMRFKMNNNKYHRTIPKSNIKIEGRGKIYNINIHIHFLGSCCSIFSCLCADCSVLQVIGRLFVLFRFDHCIVCLSSIYGFWLPLWYLQTLLVDPFVFFAWSLYCLSFFDLQLLITPLVSSNLHNVLIRK